MQEGAVMDYLRKESEPDCPPSKTFFVVSYEEKSVSMTGEIDEMTAPSFEAIIDAVRQRNKDTRPLKIFIDSEGGVIVAALRMYDALRQDASCPIWTYVKGQARSAALILLQAGDRRCVFEHAMIQFHAGQIESRGLFENEALPPHIDALYMQKLTGIFQAHINELRTLTDIVARIVSQRTGIPKKRLRRFMETALSCDASEALSLGLVDEIIASSSQKR